MPFPNHYANTATATVSGLGTGLLRADSAFNSVTSALQEYICTLPAGFNGCRIEGFVGANGFTLAGVANINGSSTLIVPPNYSFSAVRMEAGAWIVSLISNAGAERPAWQSRGLVANRMSLPMMQTGVAGNGTATQVYEQSSFRLCVDCSNVSVAWQNLSNQTADEKGQVGYDLKAAIFREVSAYSGKLGTQPLVWAAGTEIGRRSPVVAPGAISETSQTAFTATAGDRAIVRRWARSSGAAFTFYNTADLPIFEGDETNEVGTALTDHIDSNDPAGDVFSRAIGDTHVHFGPAAIIGDSATRRARVAVVNDSIGAGSGDLNNSETTMGFLNTMFGTTYQSFRVGNAGMQFFTFMQDATKRGQRTALYASLGITHEIVQAITNDIENGNGPAFMARLAVRKAENDAANIRTSVCTAPPRTNAGNTVPTSTATLRLSLNQMIRDANGCGFGYLDVAAFTYAAGGTNLWDTTGGRGTADGVHPNAATHAYLAAQLAPQLSSLLSIGHFRP